MRVTPMLTVSIAILAMLTLPAGADTFGFKQVAGSNPELEPQFLLDVDAGAVADTVEFLFHNNAPGYGMVGYCSVTDIYLYGQDLIDPASCAQTTTPPYFYNFTKSPTTPPDLPGWPGPPTNLVYSVGIQGNPTSGLDYKDESITLTFDLTGEFGDLLDDLHNGAFVVGLKVQAIWPCDNSATFVTTPVPAAALLGLLGMATAGMKLRKFV